MDLIKGAQICHSAWHSDVSGAEFIRVLQMPSSRFRNGIKMTLNPITCVGGGGFLAQTIRLLTVIIKRLILAYPDLVTVSFYLLGTFWQNSKKIHSPRGLLQLFLK